MDRARVKESVGVKRCLDPWRKTQRRHSITLTPVIDVDVELLQPRFSLSFSRNSSVVMSNVHFIHLLFNSFPTHFTLSSTF